MHYTQILMAYTPLARLARSDKLAVALGRKGVILFYYPAALSSTATLL
jgi:hypothetical protein